MRERWRSAASALAGLPSDAASYAGLTEVELLEINGYLAASRRDLGGGAALVAGEVVHRSAPELEQDTWLLSRGRSLSTPMTDIERA